MGLGRQLRGRIELQIDWIGGTVAEPDIGRGKLRITNVLETEVGARQAYPTPWAPVVVGFTAAGELEVSSVADIGGWIGSLGGIPLHRDSPVGLVRGPLLHPYLHPDLASTVRGGNRKSAGPCTSHPFFEGFAEKGLLGFRPRVLVHPMTRDSIGIAIDPRVSHTELDPQRLAREPGIEEAATAARLEVRAAARTRCLLRGAFDHAHGGASKGERREHRARTPLDSLPAFHRQLLSVCDGLLTSTAANVGQIPREPPPEPGGGSQELAR